MYVSERTDKDVIEAIQHFLKKQRPNVSAQELADYLGCSRSTVVRSIERLEAAGRLQRNSGRPNGYRLIEAAAAYAG